MSQRLTYMKLKLEAVKRGLELTTTNVAGARYGVTELSVPGGDSVLVKDLKEAWSEIYGWDNAAARRIRMGEVPLIDCEHTELTDENKERLVIIAQERVCNDELQVDDGEQEFSRSDDGGYWVRAWVWLPDSAQEECAKSVQTT